MWRLAPAMVGNGFGCSRPKTDLFASHALNEHPLTPAAQVAERGRGDILHHACIRSSDQLVPQTGSFSGRLE